MRDWIVLALLVACGVPLGAWAGDEAAVREVVRKYVDARERIDPKAVEVLLTADADQQTTSGEWRKGRSEVVRGSMASSRQTSGKRTIEVETVRFPTPDVAIADGRYEITGIKGGADRKMRTTFIMVRGGGAWHISAIRNMMPTSAPAAARRPTRRQVR